MKKIRLLIILMLTLFCTALIPCVAQAAGSKAKGASIPKYSKVVTRTVSKENFDKDLKNYLLEAEEKNSAKTQYKIILPKGTYNYNRTFRFSSNTHIYAVGTTIKFKKTTNVGLRPTNPSSTNNFILEGGTWTAMGNTTSSFVRLAHARNVIFKNATFKVKRSGHILELAAVKGVTVDGCTFSGNNVSAANIQPKEAIQLDIATLGAMKEFPPYNSEGCHDVIINNCRFNSVARGIGSHSENNKKNPYDNITVTKNTFSSLTGEAIFLESWKNCTISNNTIKKSKRAGIYAYKCKGLSLKGNNISSVGSYSGARKNAYGTDASGIFLSNTTSCTLTQNKISSCSANGILIRWASTKNKVTKNTLSKNKRYGIEILGTKGYSSKTLKKQNTFSKNKNGVVRIG